MFSVEKNNGWAKIYSNQNNKTKTTGDEKLYIPEIDLQNQLFFISLYVLFIA
jgi:hypothetical protein